MTSREKLSNYISNLFHEFRCEDGNSQTPDDDDQELNIADMLQQMHTDFEESLPSGSDYKTFALYNVKPADIEVYMVGNDLKVRAKSLGPMTGYGYRSEKTISHSFMLPAGADKNSIKSSFDVKRGVLKIEWGYKSGAEVPKFEPVVPKRTAAGNGASDEPKNDPQDEPKSEPKTEPTSEPKSNSTSGPGMAGLPSLVGTAKHASNAGKYRFSPIRPKMKKLKKKPADAIPEVEPEVPEGPNADDLRADIKKYLDKCDDVEKLEEILNMLD